MMAFVKYLDNSRVYRRYSVPSLPKFICIRIIFSDNITFEKCKFRRIRSPNGTFDALTYPGLV